MRIQFRPLFTVAVSHTFYQDRCRDFRFLLPADTVRRVAGARMLARERDGVLHVLYEADEAGDPLVRLTGARLRFGLRLLNPYFANFTQTPAGFPTRKLYYSNSGAPASLSVGASPTFVGELFTHTPTRTARPVTVTLRDSAGDVVETETLNHAVASASFDLRGRPSGLFTLEEVFPTETNTVSYLLDAQLQQLDAVGVVEVEIDDAFYASPPELALSFTAREDVLRYFVVVRNYSNSDFNQLSVSDAGFGEDGRPEVSFDRVPAASFTAAEISPSLIAAPDDRVVLFRSRTPLARRERGRRRIQLSRNRDVLIASLPQPGADRANADLIIHLSKP